MSETLGRGVGPGLDPGGLHDSLEAQPGGRAGPGPEADALAAVAALLGFSDAVDEVEGIEHRRRHGDGPVHASPAFLEGLEHQRPALEVDPVGGERQRLADPAAGVGERQAERPGAPLGALGRGEDELALLSGEVEAPAGAIKQFACHLFGTKGRILRRVTSLILSAPEAHGSMLAHGQGTPSSLASD